MECQKSLMQFSHKDTARGWELCTMSAIISQAFGQGEKAKGAITSTNDPHTHNTHSDQPCQVSWKDMLPTWER